MPWMYMLRCGDGSFYVGSTTNLELRLDQHARGQGAAFTRTRLPIELVFSEEFERIDEAYFREKQVQGWSRRKREALIQRDFATIRRLGSRARPRTVDDD